MEEATEIAKLRLFLALVASATSVDDLEPLPNIDFNIMAGNSLVGLLKVDKKAFEESDDIITQSYYHTYTERLTERNRLLDTYRHASTYAEDLRSLRDDIEKKSKEVRITLDHLLLDQFGRLGIQYQEATWDEKKKKEGKPKKRTLKISDIDKLKPFHWGFEFSEIMGKRGGFDAIVTNPPWEIFKPNGKEFFEEYSDLVTKKKMSIKDFEKEQGKLLKDKDVLKAWLGYLNEYPHVSEFYRSAEQYKNQISVVNGKKAGSDINLYKLFIEQAYNLIATKGYCGIITPTGIYTDLGTKQLRELLFNGAQVKQLISLSNERGLFEGVMHNFKFCLLDFKKDQPKPYFKAAFRIYVHEAIDISGLANFLNDESNKLEIPLDVVKKYSPESLSIMEWKNKIDLKIIEKFLDHPLLGAELDGPWNFKLTAEFHMTNDSDLFHTSPISNSLPLFEGKMIHQFTDQFCKPQFWVQEKAGRNSQIGKGIKDVGTLLDYQEYRIGIRAVGGSANERGLIATIIPHNVFCGNSVLVSTTKNIKSPLNNEQKLLLVGLLNSFSVDYCIRQSVATNVNMFYIYQLHVPRLDASHPRYRPIIERAAKLICTSSEFGPLWQEVMGSKWNKQLCAIEDSQRDILRSELDGIVSNIYGLSEEEFIYILGTFPVVPQTAKDAALEQYRAFAPKSSDEEVLALIKAGESHTVEFKETARWDVRQNQPSKVMEKVVLDTVAAFLNSEGGTLLIGVKDDKTVSGLEPDYHVFGKKENMRDIYENWLIQYLLSQYQKDIAPCLKVTFHQINGKDVCRLTISQSPRAVYVRDGNNEQFFIRTGNSKKQLSTSETVQYCKQKWPV
jgi:hypothetical protein